MKVAIIGLGHRIVDVYHNLVQAAGGRIELLGYADPSPSGLEDLRRHGHQPGRAFVDHRRLLAELRPEAVLIGSPNHCHFEHIRDSLAAGCRVFSEKPVVIDREQTLAVARLIAAAGPERIRVGLPLRMAGFFTCVREQLAALGRLISVEANEHLAPEHGGFLMRDWRRKRAWSGSHILEKCCHDIDALQAVCGRARRVASFGGRSIFLPENGGRERDGRYHAWKEGWQGTAEVFASDGDILDHQVAIIETERGVRLTFHLNNHVPGAARRWLLCALDGCLEGDFGRPTVELRRAFGEASSIPLPVAQGTHYGADPIMGADLAACWLEGVPFPVPVKAALEAGLTCMGIDQAQREGQVLDLGPWMQELDAILA